jgi:alpha-tubulin suppressor-like RCC1 family protein
MSAIDKATLRSKLEELIKFPEIYDNATTDVDDVISIALSASLLDENNILVVANKDQLPILSFYDSPDSIMCYIEDLGVFVISANDRWLTLDGRLVQANAVALAWSWGCNGSGQLGDGATTNRSSPVSVIGGFTDWCQVSAGQNHSLGVRTNGTVWSWGNNVSGRLGDGTTVNKSSPVLVVGGFTDWYQVSAGGYHSLGVRVPGYSAWAWGCNGSGQLGDGTTVDKSSPASVISGFTYTYWYQVSAGANHSLGIAYTFECGAGVWSWGNNSSGQLGDGTTTNRSSPVFIPAITYTYWSQVSAGNAHSLALNVDFDSYDQKVWSWGCNGSGQLGDGTTMNRSSPVSAIDSFTDWCQVSAGSSHSLGVRCNGTAWAWGNNVSGRLGDGTTTNRSSPVSVIGGFTDWCQVSAGELHSLGLRSNGTAWAWGCGAQGRLGDGSIVNKSSPVSVVGGFTGWCQISAASGSSNLGIRGIC